MIGGDDIQSQSIVDYDSFVNGCDGTELREKCIQLGILSRRDRRGKVKRRIHYLNLIQHHIEQQQDRQAEEDEWAQCETCKKWRMVSWQFNPTQQVSIHTKAPKVLYIL